jgi:hypothetical protein
MNYANSIGIDVGNDIYAGKLILQNGIRKTTGDIETTLDNTGQAENQ